VIVLDIWMPHISGKELLERIRSDFPHIPVIIVTAANDIDQAVDCMKQGAFDYLVKPVENSRFTRSVLRAIEMNTMRGEITTLREGLLAGRPVRSSRFSAIITQDRKMDAVFTYLEAIAGINQPVLITGETGVGKDLIVRALHELSGRPGQFVPVNVAGLDDNVFSDALFGHTKGAFTGAEQAREGMISRAAGGTLFLDEIGDLNPTAQIKLLRLLQDGEYYPLGSDVARRSDARIVMATNQNIEEMVSGRRFRKDLYYRLSAHKVQIPPLRERKDDIPLLLDHFLSIASEQLSRKKPSCPPDLVTYLQCYHFPGNIRELKALVFDATARHTKGILSMSSFRNALGIDMPYREDTARSTAVRDLLDTGRKFPTLKETENMLIAEAMDLSKGNQGLAASMLGISRQALNQRLMRKRSENDV
jgi:DNA-binding NtrC family response regulator